MLCRYVNAKHKEMQSCDLCKRKFKNKDELDDHRLVQHTTVATANNDERCILNRKDCILCSFKCKTETDMKYHMIHLHNVKICHKCEKLFICIENLKNHIDQCDSDDLSDINMNDSEYKDILAEIMNEPEDI